MTEQTTHEKLLALASDLAQAERAHKSSDKTWKDAEKTFKARADIKALWEKRETERKAYKKAENDARALLEQYRREGNTEFDGTYYSIDDDPVNFTVDNPQEFIMRLVLLHPQIAAQVLSIDSKKVAELLLDGQGEMKPEYAMVPLKKTHRVKTTIHWSKLGVANMTRLDGRKYAAEEAQKLLNLKGVVIDTETTGLGDDRQVVSICIADSATGEILVNTLVKPTTLIEPGATAVHGISMAKVKDAKTMDELADEINKAINGRTILGYNIQFDIEAIRNSSEKIDIPSGPRDVMLTYARFAGETNNFGLKNHKLSVACEAMGMSVSNSSVHTASGDVALTLGLLKRMAEWKPASAMPEPPAEDDHPTEEIPVAKPAAVTGAGTSEKLSALDQALSDAIDAAAFLEVPETS